MHATQSDTLASRRRRSWAPLLACAALCAAAAAPLAAAHHPSHEYDATDCTGGPLVTNPRCKSVHVDESNTFLTWALDDAEPPVEAQFAMYSEGGETWLGVGAPGAASIEATDYMLANAAVCTPLNGAAFVNLGSYALDGSGVNSADAAAVGVTDLGCTVADGASALTFTVTFGEGNFVATADAATYFTWARGQAGAAVLAFHGDDQMGVLQINVASGHVTEGDDKFSSQESTHAWLMIVSWGLLVPLAVIFATFHKRSGEWVPPTAVEPGHKPPRWVLVHFLVMLAAVACILAAFAVIVQHINDKAAGHFNGPHKGLGFLVIIFVMLQVLMVAGMGSPPFPKKTDPSYKRVNGMMMGHKHLGRFTAGLSIIVTYLGIMIHAPPGETQTTMAIVYSSLLALMLAWGLYRFVGGHHAIPDGEIEREEKKFAEIEAKQKAGRADAERGAAAAGGAMDSVAPPTSA